MCSVIHVAVFLLVRTVTHEALGSNPRQKEFDLSRDSTYKEILKPSQADYFTYDI